MDELDRMFRRLVEVVRAEHPSLIDRPIEVGELYQSVLPYRHHRRELGFDSNQDYELAMMRLLSGERGYVRGDSRMQERLRQELGSGNPDLALFRGFSTTTVTLDPEAVARASGGDVASSRGEARPVADQQVTQRVADDRVPPERPRPATPPPPPPAPMSPMAPSAPPVSSPDAETIVFRRTPNVGPMPPMPPVMSPAPSMPSAGAQGAAPPPPAASSADVSTSSSGARESAARQAEPILLRSNETLTIRPDGEVISSLGEPASASTPAAAAAAPAPSSPSPTPLPSVGPPPRPRAAAPAPAPATTSSISAAPVGSSAAGESPRTADGSAAAAAGRRDARGDAAIRSSASTISSRTPMATPQRGAHTIVASGDCRYCGGVLPEGRQITFCPHCGQNLTIQHCPACSTELELGWKFCTTCGRSVEEARA